jgi:hypothetical protein
LISVGGGSRGRAEAADSEQKKQRNVLPGGNWQQQQLRRQASAPAEAYVPSLPKRQVIHAISCSSIGFLPSPCARDYFVKEYHSQELGVLYIEITTQYFQILYHPNSLRWKLHNTIIMFQDCIVSFKLNSCFTFKYYTRPLFILQNTFLVLQILHVQLVQY